MKIYLATLLLVCGFGAMAQTAKVIQLSDAEAKLAKSLDDDQKALDNRREKLNNEITTKYLTENSPGCLGAGTCMGGGAHIKSGWGSGFEYSEDYKFIVPKGGPNPCPYLLGQQLNNCYMPSPWITNGTNILTNDVWHPSSIETTPPTSMGIPPNWR